MPKPHLGKSHIPTNGGFSAFEAMLIHQPIVYPMCRMSLLCRLFLVVFQPAFDSRQIIPQRRERLSDSAPCIPMVHPVLLS
jgi:hypothetical protein